ncbi:MAG: tripartite tricarboxylate transporter TctB family protein [Proteobacteria bacterium]|nr:tripartite tricarboxylate transporter TctB family protein [Burkholderiales bacterium]
MSESDLADLPATRAPQPGFRQPRHALWTAGGLLLATLAIASGYLYLTLALPTPAVADPLGPQIFPMLVSGGLFLCGAMMGLELWRSRIAIRRTALPAAPSETSFDLRSALMVAGITGWTALYFFVFERVGFVVSTIVFLFGLMSVFNARHPVVNAACATGFAFGAWLLFVKVLSVRLPSGILPF